MRWQKLSEADDLLVYEKKGNDLIIRIEARHNKRKWDVFKTYVDREKSHLVEEYTAADKKEMKKLVTTLKEEELTLDQINQIKEERNKKLEFTFERAYKEDFIEKWVFYNQESSNFLVIRYDEEVEVDVVVNEMFRYFEESIIQKINHTLGLEKLGDVTFRIYYFRKKSDVVSETKKKLGLFVSRIEMDFDE